MEMLYKLFKEKTENMLIQFFRYLFVGGAATVVDWCVSGFCNIGLVALFNHLIKTSKTADIIAALIANTLGFVFGLVVNFLISKIWVFTGDSDASQGKTFLRFAAIGIAGLVITWITTFAMTSLLTDWPYIQMLSKIVSTAAAFLWNFFARKYLVFCKN